MNSSLLAANVNGLALASPAIEALGWTLLHFLWQGTALALGLASFLALSRHASPRVRYAAGCAALSLMFLAATATFAWQFASCNSRARTPGIAKPLAAVLPRVDSLQRIFEREIVPTRSFPTERDFVLPSGTTQGFADKTESADLPVAHAVSSAAVWTKWAEPLRAWLSWLVGLWGLGVGLFSLRLAAGWKVIRRLRTQAEERHDPVWSARFGRLRARLGVSAPVRLLWSTSATVPMVIGWMRPVVLVPAGLVTGLSVSQLEAVLAHELAHIRRHDFLVNLLQNVVETLFFYHPAVWWVSRQIRSEREHCCDDLAAATCRSALDYARALTALAALRHAPGTLGLAATGGSLVGRIARLAGMETPGPRAGWTLPALVLAAGAATAFFAVSASSQSGEAPNPAAATRQPGTRSVAGRLLDAEGRPVSDAIVWLTASDGKGLSVVLRGQSKAEGRFLLTLDEANLRQLAASDPACLELWVRKPGFALAHHVERGGPPEHPIEIRLSPEDPVSVRLHKPDGSPCSNATVVPTAVRMGDELIPIPEGVRDILTAHSGADGRIAIRGMRAGQVDDLRFDTPEFGVQSCRFPSREWPDQEAADITLRKTGTLKGRLIPPAGSRPDLSRVKLRVITYFNLKKPGSTAWMDEVTIQSDREGRFAVPKLAEGSVWIVPEVPDGMDCRTDGFGYRADRPNEKLLIAPGLTASVEVPLWKGVRVTRLVRDGQTKKPLRGVPVVLDHKSDWVKTKTDANGTFAAWIRPDVEYRMNVELPEGYVRRNSASFAAVLVHSGAKERELEPIELTRGRTVEGTVVDPSGEPLGGVRIAADWRLPDEEEETRPEAGVQARKWTTADSQGRFRFDELVSGVPIMLRPVRAGVVLAEPLRVEPANDKPVRLQTARFDFTALTGRVVDREGKPVAGMEVAIERLETEEQKTPLLLFGAQVGMQVRRGQHAVDALRIRTDADGRFQTPAYFPKQFLYWVAVSSHHKDVCSAPRRPAESNGKFPDLVIDRPDLFSLSRFVGSEVIATVNGEPILAAEVLARAWPEPLEPDRMSLLLATQELAAGRMREEEYRVLQETAIRRYLKESIKNRLLTQALLVNLDKQQKQMMEEAISKMFEEYVGKLEKDLSVSSRDAANEKLKRQGTSLENLRNEFRLRLLADEYLRSKSKTVSASPQAVEAWYQKHLEDYSEPERVRWQLLEISFGAHGGPDGALAVARKAEAELRLGADFASAVRKYADGPRPIGDGRATRMNFETPDDGRLLSAIRKLDSGDIKTMFDFSGWSDVKLGPEQARSKSRDVVTDERLEQAVRKYYDKGGEQPWTNPASLADPRLAAVLQQLAPGEISSVVEGAESFRIVRLIDRRPAGRKPFDEVEASIRQKIEKQRREQTLNELYRQASIESAYFVRSDLTDSPHGL